MTPYFAKIAAAFVRGRRLQGKPIELSHDLGTAPLSALSEQQLATIIGRGHDVGLKLHKFKRTMELQRVHKVFGMLASIGPANLLDIGSGRGPFLWPLLHEFPDLAVTAIDVRADRARDLAAVRLGGIERLTAARMDAAELCFADRSFDVACLLEVLEHISAAQQVLAQTVRVTRRFVALSVPSKPDDNPGHLRCFDQDTLREMFYSLGVARVTFSYVPGHIIALAKVEN